MATNSQVAEISMEKFMYYGIKGHLIPVMVSSLFLMKSEVG